MVLLNQHAREVFKMRETVSLFYLFFIKREKGKNCSVFLSPPTARDFSVPPKLVEDPPTSAQESLYKNCSLCLQMAHESYKMSIPRSSFDRHTLQQLEFEEKMLSEGFNRTGKPLLVRRPPSYDLPMRTEQNQEPLFKQTTSELFICILQLVSGKRLGHHQDALQIQ